ncbi:hypothetical protein C2E23DRAFT_731163 [Lenzites betulinus]|nr:hypothetical protein C2E23DRAFT_731163 [Lenzites betulinus]
MSSAGKTFGTASPPAEDKTMGISSIDAGKPEAVPDSQQRKSYFKDAGKHDDSATQTDSGKPVSTHIIYSLMVRVSDDIYIRLRRSRRTERATFASPRVQHNECALETCSSRQTSILKA